MGALQKIRSQSTLLVITIAIGLICFIVPWHEVMNMVNMAKNKVFQVNGETIKIEEYLSNIESEQLLQEAAYGRQLNETQMTQLRESVYQTMVSDIIIKEQAAKVGLTITEAELANMLTNVTPGSYLYYVPFFIDPQTGMFSREALNNFLSAVNQPLAQDPTTRNMQMKYRNLWQYIQNKLETTTLQNRYSTMLYRGLTPNNIEIEDYKAGFSPEATISYVKVDDSDINNADVAVSETEIKNLYDLRNQAIFKSDYPTKTISFFIKEIVPSEQDYAQTLELANSVVEQLKATNSIVDISAIVNDYSSQGRFVNAFVALNDIRDPQVKAFVETSNVGDVQGPVQSSRSYNVYKYLDNVVAPDSISVQILPLMDGAQAFTPTAINLVDSLKNTLNSGKSFTDLTKEVYPNQPNVDQIVDFTEQAMAMYVDNVSQYFNAPVGSVHQINFSNTLALMHIVGKTKPVNKVKIAAVNIAVDPSENTFTAVDNEINSFIANENKDISNFGKVALEKGYDLTEDFTVQPNLLSIANIPGSREVVRWAFSDDNKNIKRFDFQDLRIVAVVTGSAKEGLLPVTNKNVNESLKNTIMNGKKSAMIVDLLNKESNKDLTALASKYNSIVDTVKFVAFNTKDVDYPLNLWSKFGGEEQSKAIIGVDGVYVMDVISKQDNSTPKDQQIIKQDIMTNYGMTNGMFMFQIFNEKSEIKDNRLKFNF